MFNITNETIFFLDVDGLTDSKLQVLAFDGIEGLNSEYVFEITLINSYPRFDITQLLSKPAYLSFTANRKQGIHGIIQAVKRGALDAHYGEYKIVLTPRFTHLHKRLNQRAFVNKTVLEIITTIFNEHGILESIDFELQLKDKSIYTPREFCCQYQETDAHFIYRLTEECGMAIRYEFTQTNHKMIISDAQPFFPSLAKAIPYKSNTGLVADTPVIKRFDVRLVSAPLLATERNYDFKTKATPESSYDGVQSEKANQAIEIPLEHYHFPGRLINKATASQQAQISIERLRANHILAEAYGDIPTLHAAYHFTLQDYPDTGTLNTEEPWLITQIKHQGRQPQVLEALGSAASADSYLTTLLENYYKYPLAKELQFPTEEIQQGYRNCFVATPLSVTYRPQRLHFKRKVQGAQTAIVTGPEDEEIYCDEYGRVKVQFHWDRQGQFTEKTSHWVRVASSWAHNNYGAVEIPRIGMEVVVDFLDGDIDHPLIRGAVHNGINKTPNQLPKLKAQSTFKSKEHRGSGYNELLIDDTTGELKTQLHSTYESSQLTLGFLTQPRDEEHKGAIRGEGFELRTDAWGAVRAGKGLYLSAHEQSQAKGSQLDLEEAIEQLKAALKIAEDLAKASQTAQATQADTTDQQEQLSEVYTDLNAASILASAPEGIALVTPKSAQISALANVTVTAGDSADLSVVGDFRVAAGEAISLFCIEDDMKLIANKGKIKMQAQNSNMEIVANKDLKILSTEDKIEIIADKEIILSSGDAYIKIKDGNIYLHAPGTVEQKAASYTLKTPASSPYQMPKFDQADGVERPEVEGTKGEGSNSTDNEQTASQATNNSATNDSLSEAETTVSEMPAFNEASLGQPPAFNRKPICLECLALAAESAVITLEAT